MRGDGITNDMGRATNEVSFSARAMEVETNHIQEI